MRSQARAAYPLYAVDGVGAPVEARNAKPRDRGRLPCCQQRTSLGHRDPVRQEFGRVTAGVIGQNTEPERGMGVLRVARGECVGRKEATPIIRAGLALDLGAYLVQLKRRH